MNFNLVNVGIADLVVAREPDILRTVLGSCVGICLYDSEKKVGGLAHIMLPVMSDTASNRKKYADTAIPMLLEEMEKQGAQRSRITAKISGGAAMFKMSANSMMSEIGRNNIKKVREILESMGIKILGEDVGGDYGRTIDFYTENGQVKVKSLGREEKIF